MAAARFQRLKKLCSEEKKKKAPSVKSPAASCVQSPWWSHTLHFLIEVVIFFFLLMHPYTNLNQICWDMHGSIKWNEVLLEFRSVRCPRWWKLRKLSLKCWKFWWLIAFSLARLFFSYTKKTALLLFRSVTQIVLSLRISLRRRMRKFDDEIVSFWGKALRSKIGS